MVTRPVGNLIHSQALSRTGRFSPRGETLGRCFFSNEGKHPALDLLNFIGANQVDGDGVNAAQCATGRPVDYLEVRRVSFDPNPNAHGQSSP